MRDDDVDGDAATADEVPHAPWANGDALAFSGIETTLRDGTRAVVRPIQPTDKDRLQAGLHELSPQSRYLRFHTPITHLSDQQLRYLTEVDYFDHMAWVAVNPDEPDEPGMGVARYVRLDGEPDVAEAAVTVLDKYQGLGLGTFLLKLLSASAVRNGVRTFRNYVLAENRAMLELFDELGGVRISEGDGVYRVDVVLTEPEPDESADVRHILRAAAKRALPAFRWVFPFTAEEHFSAKDGADEPAGPAGTERGD